MLEKRVLSALICRTWHWLNQLLEKSSIMKCSPRRDDVGCATP
jgi:hypothetical protein